MEDKKEKNLYHKIQELKIKLLKSNPKKSGKNSFAGFSYYELADFLPTIENLCMELNLCTKVSFTNELATLEIINADDPKQRETYTSPMREIIMKGTNEIQALGGVETYQRRYLYMAAFDITENDMFDGKNGNATKEKQPSDFEALGKQPISEERMNELKELVKECNLTDEEFFKGAKITSYADVNVSNATRIELALTKKKSDSNSNVDMDKLNKVLGGDK